MLELGSTRGKHLFADANMVVHRSADIEEQQNLHLIVPLGYQFEIEVAAVVSCRFDRVRQIKFGGRAFTGKFSKPSKRDLNVADTDLDTIVEVFEFAYPKPLPRGGCVILLCPIRTPSGL